MKNFNFTLSPLLRLRRVEQRKIELELAMTLLDINKHIEQIALEEDSIRDTLIDCEFVVLKKRQAGKLMMNPTYIAEKKMNIKLLQISLEKIEKKKEEIIQRLAKKENEIKKIEELELEQKNEYKKNLNKIEQQNLEELHSIIKKFKGEDYE